jgi:hypothetical protein
MPTLFRNVRSRGQTGKHMLALSFSGFDPSGHCELDGHTPVLAHRLSALRYWIGARQMAEAGVERRLY